MKELLSIDNTLVISGIGGELLSKCGVRIIQDSSELTTFGFYEGLRNYPRLKRIYQKVVNYLKAFCPDIFLPIAFGGFNLKLARLIKKMGKKVVYFAPPQLWAWGKWRAKTLRENTDKVICLFPFEAKFFQDLKINAVYLGNPLLDYLKPVVNHLPPILNNIPVAAKIITFMPGSRKEEIKHHLPLMLKIFERLKVEFDNTYGFVITPSDDYKPNLDRLYYTIESKYLIMAKSDLIILSSGTASLEAAILEVPHIALYHLSPITYLIARSMVRLKRFTLANILLGENVVPEFVQPTFNKVFPKIIELLTSPNKTIRNSLSRVKKILGEPGASQRIAHAIISQINRGK